MPIRAIRLADSFTGKTLKSERGVALLMALVVFMLLTYIAIEVSYDTAIDYTISKQQVARIQARYAAKSGVELSLLRVKLYKQAAASPLGTMIPRDMLDKIWNFPFMWPPTAALDLPGVKLTEADKSTMKDSVEESLMEGQFTTVISPESARLDINALGNSDLPKFQKLMYDQVLTIFRSELQHNDRFRDKYAGFNFEQMVANIADYIDPNQEGLLGGDEAGPYRDVRDRDVQMPPNRSLRTIDELHQVAGMNDDFYNILAPKVTVYGTRRINVNYANKDTLMALDPSMTEEAVNRAINRRESPREGGPFKDANDFFNFIQGFGVNVGMMKTNQVDQLLDFGVEFNFRIVSTGIAGNMKRQITAITYDYTNIIPRLIKQLNEVDPLAQGTAAQPVTSGTSPQGAPGADPALDKIQTVSGRPVVVSWDEN
jgi:general secretion pathway protein K